MALQKIGEPAQETVGALVVVELVNSKEGNYKKLSDGTIVPLTDKEWRKELTKSLSKAPAFTYTTEAINADAIIPKPRLQKIWKEKKKLNRIG